MNVTQITHFKVITGLDGDDFVKNFKSVEITFGIKGSDLRYKFMRSYPLSNFLHVSPKVFAYLIYQELKKDFLIN